MLWGTVSVLTLMLTLTVAVDSDRLALLFSPFPGCGHPGETAPLLVDGGGLFLPAGQGSLFGGSGAVAVDGELEDHGVMDDPVDGGGRGHGVLEDLIPLAEHQVGGDEHTPALVTFSEQGEEHFHLLAVLLNVADVVEDHRFEADELAHFRGQTHIALGGHAARHEPAAGAERP